MKEEALCQFAAYLGQQKLRYRTIKSYLSGIRFAQIDLNLGDPFKDKSLPRLNHVLTGIKQVQARAGPPPKPRLPITPVLLERLRAIWLGVPLQADNYHALGSSVHGSRCLSGSNQPHSMSSPGDDPVPRGAESITGPPLHLQVRVSTHAERSSSTPAGSPQETRHCTLCLHRSQLSDWRGHHGSQKWS